MIFNLHCVRSAMFIASSGGTVHMFLSLITSILFFVCVCVRIAFLFSIIKELHLSSWELLIVLIH